LAAELCATPIATVNTIEASKQVPNEHRHPCDDDTIKGVICRHTDAKCDRLVFPDLFADKRTAARHLVRGGSRISGRKALSTRRAGRCGHFNEAPMTRWSAPAANAAGAGARPIVSFGIVEGSTAGAIRS